MISANYLLSSLHPQWDIRPQLALIIGLYIINIVVHVTDAVEKCNMFCRLVYKEGVNLSAPLSPVTISVCSCRDREVDMHHMLVMVRGNLYHKIEVNKANTVECVLYYSICIMFS